jgi:hypothetical protein
LIEHLLMAFVAPFVARDQAALIAHFDMTRIELHRHCPAGRRRRRIEIGAHPYAAESVHTRKRNLCQLEVLLRKRQELRALRDRALNEEFRRRTKTQASLPDQDSVLLLPDGLLRCGQIVLRRIDGRNDLPKRKPQLKAA